MSVELVDRSGSTLKTTVQGFRNIGPGSLVTIKGKVIVTKGGQGRKGKNVRILATGFYVHG